MGYTISVHCGYGDGINMEEWQRSFLTLHQKLGVRRSDIYDRLDAELRTLWRITPDLQRDVDEVRRRIKDELEALFEEFLTTEDVPHRENVLLSLRLSYNILGEFEKDDLRIRQKKLANREGARGNTGNAESTIRDHVKDFRRYAVRAIERRLASLSPPNPQPLARALSPLGDDIQPPQTTGRRRGRTRVLFTGIALASALLVAIALVVVVLNRRSSSGIQPRGGGTGSASPTPVAAQEDLQIKSRIITLDDEPGSVMPGVYKPSPALERKILRQGGMQDPDLQRILQTSAVKLSNLSIQIDLKGLSRSPIRVTNIKAMTYRRLDPMNGTLFEIPTGQGIDPTVRLNLNLDKPQPLIRELIFPPQRGEELNLDPPKVGNPFFLNHVVSLKKSEDQTLIIESVTMQHYVEFGLELHYIANGQEKRVAINNEGRPFKVTGPRCGTTVGTYSYERAYTAQGNYSLLQEPNPDRMGVDEAGCGG